MNTPLFYCYGTSTCNLFRGAANCYSLSCLHEDGGLGDVPALGGDKVIMDNHPLAGYAVHFLRTVHVDVLYQFRHHALGEHPYIGILPDRIEEQLGGHRLTALLAKLFPQGLNFRHYLVLFLLVLLRHTGKPKTARR